MGGELTSGPFTPKFIFSQTPICPSVFPMHKFQVAGGPLGSLPGGGHKAGSLLGSSLPHQALARIRPAGSSLLIPGSPPPPQRGCHSGGLLPSLLPVGPVSSAVRWDICSSLSHVPLSSLWGPWAPTGLSVARSLRGGVGGMGEASTMWALICRHRALHTACRRCGRPGSQ